MFEMYKIPTAIPALVLLCCLSVSSCAPTRPPIELHVGPACQFSSIQAAINTAHSRDTVIVHPATYNENIIVRKSLTIRSAKGVATTIIKAKECSKPVVTINTDFAALDGFTISGSDSAGIYLLGSHNDVSNNKVVGNRNGIFLGSGEPIVDDVAISAAACSRVMNNLIMGNRDYGLLLNGHGMHHISTNTILNSEVGIELSGLFETQNKVCGNLVKGCAVGINVLSRENLVLSNTIVGSGSGVKIEGFGNKILGNSIESNTLMTTGIHITEWGGTRENCNILCWNNVTNNSLAESESFGVLNEGEYQIYTVRNWWGTPTGPTHYDNPDGTGDTVSNNVLYRPWLAQPYVALLVENQDPTVTTSDIHILFDTSGRFVVGSVFAGVYPASPPSPLVSYAGIPGKVLKCFDIYISGFGADAVTIEVNYTDNEVSSRGIDEMSLRVYVRRIGDIWQEAENSQVDIDRTLVQGSVAPMYNEDFIEGALACRK